MCPRAGVFSFYFSFLPKVTYGILCIVNSPPIITLRISLEVFTAGNCINNCFPSLWYEVKFSSLSKPPKIAHLREENLQSEGKKNPKSLIILVSFWVYNNDNQIFESGFFFFFSPPLPLHFRRMKIH
jgi:hypothetical protein